MPRVIVRHTGEGQTSPQFTVVRASDHLDAAPVEVPSPVGFPVEGQGQRDLMQELRWYLEEFLDYPFEPSTVRADRLLAACQRWGDAAFDALFRYGVGRDFYTEAIRGSVDLLTVEIRSDEPDILAWPWEALRDTATCVPLGVTAQIERRLTNLAQPPALAEGLPRDRLRILLVIARPYEADIGFHSIARPLVEQIEAEQFPAEVTVLRPPTFERLQEVLEQNPDTFHILHFDGHGGYGSAAHGSGTPHQYAGPEGRLIFEDDRGGPAPVEASKLGALLARHKLPAVVLNACQSAMLDERAEDPFASVAAALLRGGVRSVVAMAYSLYVSAAQVFLPAFYKRLFETGDIGRATQDGRRRMFDRRERVCVRGRFPLEDWLIPVLYQQAKLDFSFVQTPAKQSETERAVELPRAAKDIENPHGFVGRDSALLALERALRRKPAGILVHGLGGVGKTTLARGFVNWLAQTHGLGAGVLWVDFRDVRSAEYVVNELLGPLAGTQALALPLDAKLRRVTKLLRDHAVLVVWDNFESARTIEGSDEASLPDEEQQTLAKLLEQLRGGKSKVLLTSRSEERWLGGPQTCTRVQLGGLSGEERWTFCQVILDDLGLVIDRQDPDQVALMNKLGGHPLLMRAVLPKLESMTAGQIAKAVESNLAAVMDGEDELGSKVLATLAFVEQSLSEELVPLLVPLSLHEHFVVANDLEAMGAEVPGDWSRGRIDALLNALTAAGLVTRRGPEALELHPALTTYLRARVAGDGREEAWQRRFVDRLAIVADALPSWPLHEQRPVFVVHGANFRHALALAKTLQMNVHVAALTQSLADYALNTRDFATARQLFDELARYGAREREHATEAGAYHQLGMVAQEQRNLEEAERWYRKSLAISEKQGNEQAAASTYHQLGNMAHLQRDFEAAERWYRRALAIKQKLGNEQATASTFHQLGIVAEEQRNFEAAEHWYRMSLAIEERLGNKHGAALTYHQLGNLAHQQRDFAAAELWYRKSLFIQQEQGDLHGAASAYHQLGMVAQEQGDFEAAERWYRKSLAIKEKTGDEYGASSTYFQLGTTAHAQGDIEAAERWLQKALSIYEKDGNQYAAAMTYDRLGILTQEQGDLTTAERWYWKALAIFKDQSTIYEATIVYRHLAVCIGERLGADGAEQAYRDLVGDASPQQVKDIVFQEQVGKHLRQSRQSLDQGMFREALAAAGHALSVAEAALRGSGLPGMWTKAVHQISALAIACMQKTTSATLDPTQDNFTDQDFPKHRQDVPEASSQSPHAILATSWSLLGDAYRMQRLPSAQDKKTRQRVPQTRAEVDAYRAAAHHYNLASGDAELQEHDALRYRLYHVHCLNRLGAWNDAHRRVQLLIEDLGRLRRAQNKSPDDVRSLSMLTGEALLESASIKRLLGDYEGAVHRLADARRLFSRIDYPLGEQWTIVEQATLFIQAGDLAKSASVLQELPNDQSLFAEIRRRKLKLTTLIKAS